MQVYFCVCTYPLVNTYNNKNLIYKTTQLYPEIILKYTQITIQNQQFLQNSHNPTKTFTQTGSLMQTDNPTNYNSPYPKILILLLNYHTLYHKILVLNVNSFAYNLVLEDIFIWDSGDIYSRLWRSNTARGSCTGLVTVGPTKVQGQ